jgi:hypothetical protein
MRLFLLASLLASTLATPGCALPGCGAFEGGGNRAYERSSEMLLLCENGGFVATLDASMLEGRYTTASDTGVVTGTRGEDSALAFELTDLGDGTAMAPELGDAAWTAVTLDKVAADHSNVLCNDLTTRGWWGAQ